MSEILRLHVPANNKYIQLVEEFMHSASRYIHPESDTMRSKLCAVMNEVFANIVNHSDTARLDELVRMQFEIGARSLIISIYDQGPGIKVEGSLPPYPAKLISRKFPFRKVVDGSVFLTIINPYSVAFHFEPREQSDYRDPALLENLKGHGYGISIITKIMDSVMYNYIGKNTFDWQMIKNFES